MKTLLVLRHAKSDWNAAYGGDHERPLNERGQRAARCIGRFLASIDQVPDRVLTSTALRARTTVELAASEGAWDAVVEREAALYETGPDAVLERVTRTTEDCASLLLVGHEPTWSSLVGRCIGSGRVRFPTAALARVDFAVERWSEVGFALGELVWFVTPKLLSKIGV